MLDELTLRRPEFDENRSVAIVFAGGVAFHVPRPEIVIRAKFEGGRPIAAHAQVRDAEIEALIATLRAVEAVEPDEAADQSAAPEAHRLAEEERKNTEWYIAVADLAACLLRRNYDLNDEQLGELLLITADTDWLRRIPLIARGIQ